MLTSNRALWRRRGVPQRYRLSRKGDLLIVHGPCITGSLPIKPGETVKSQYRVIRMHRATALAAIIWAMTITSAPAEEAQELTCTGAMIEPAGESQASQTLKMGLGPKVTLNLGKGAVQTRTLSNNKIQLKFRTKDFEGEYFHYTGDLFLIYKSGHLARMTCQKN